MRRLLPILLLTVGCEVAAERHVLPPSPTGSGLEESIENDGALSSSATGNPVRDADIAAIKDVLGELQKEIADLKEELKERCAKPPDTTVEKRQPNPAAPVVYYFIAPFDCPPCDRMLKDIESDTEFQWKKGDATKWTGGFPAQQWQIDGKWLQTGIHKGWVNFNEFKAAYYASLVKQPVTNAIKVYSHYPVRGGWWSGCYSWQHLTQGEHYGKFDQTWLSQLSYEEVQSLHSDDHEGRVHWNYVVRPQPVQQTYRRST